jgi:hypothetical protein
MSKGYVYILSNPAMPGIVKIGRTSGDPETRAAQLQSTGVPLPFKVEFSVFCPDCVDLEMRVHNMLPDKRINGSREFFTYSVPDAIDLLTGAHVEQLEEWVFEFTENMTLVENIYVVDTSFFHIAGKILGRHFSEIPQILEEARSQDAEFDIFSLCVRLDERKSGVKKEGNYEH